MQLPLFFARRYLFSKKKHTSINIMSMISLVGVAVGAMALVVILSVYNGFDSYVRSLYSTFDPELKITPAEGKFFKYDDALKAKLMAVDGVQTVSRTLEENALVRYANKQQIITVKGVDDSYSKVVGIDSMLVGGNFILTQGDIDKASVGAMIAQSLGIGVNFMDPLFIYLPNRDATDMQSPDSFSERYVFPTSIFQTNLDYDMKYVMVPIRLLDAAYNFTNEASALEVKVKPGANLSDVYGKMKEALGSKYEVKDRFMQNEVLFRIMKSEKWIIYMILSLILIVASFNIIGSLSMLMLDKQEDVFVLRSLGASSKLIERIFLFEGWLISIFGASIGVVLGLGVALLQKYYKIVKLSTEGAFVLDAYPVKIEAVDLLAVFITVVLIGYFAARYPISSLKKQLV
ncbi:ABC transporter permease [uncultured Acetobacteroides sp.]|uniref:ABC transporter permease n=1 Tax=uncultured Acetobacteroides sp. TaxID=1760811 RepID=UPI0029F58740|nr:ABC transporter permease [uncultured Acetobacteroides sp.]